MKVVKAILAVKLMSVFFVYREYEGVYDLKDYQSQVKCLTKRLKEEKVKYKRCSTYEEFDILQEQLSYEINKRKDKNN